VLVDSYGWPITGLAFLSNVVVAWRLFGRAGELTRLFGHNWLRASSKVASLILAAIAVRFIREGSWPLPNPQRNRCRWRTRVLMRPRRASNRCHAIVDTARSAEQ
jgi:hypothetical protein